MAKQAINQVQLEDKIEAAVRRRREEKRILEQEALHTDQDERFIILLVTHLAGSHTV